MCPTCFLASERSQRQAGEPKRARSLVRLASERSERGPFLVHAERAIRAELRVKVFRVAERSEPVKSIEGKGAERPEKRPFMVEQLHFYEQEEFDELIFDFLNVGRRRPFSKVISM